jgi:hypothetical protein
MKPALDVLTLVLLLLGTGLAGAATMRRRRSRI